MPSTTSGAEGAGSMSRSSASTEPSSTVSALTGFDPAREVTPIELAGAAMNAAWDYIKSPDDPPFEDVKSDHRILAMATALVATEHLLDALRDIRGMLTPHGNATVKRMADRAAIAMEARQSGDRAAGLRPKDESAGRNGIAQGPSQ